MQNKIEKLINKEMYFVIYKYLYLLYLGFSYTKKQKHTHTKNLHS